MPDLGEQVMQNQMDHLHDRGEARARPDDAVEIRGGFSANPARGEEHTIQKDYCMPAPLGYQSDGAPKYQPEASYEYS